MKLGLWVGLGCVTSSCIVSVPEPRRDASNGPMDGRVAFIDGGVAFIDGGILDANVGPIDGRVSFIDGGVAFIDGGPAFFDGGPRFIDGGVAFIDGGVSSIPPGYVLIPSGTFMMGSAPGEPGRENDCEGPVHSVTISRPFYMKQVEVTQREWQAAMGANPSYYSGCGPECPVDQVSWDQAIAYVNWLSDQEGRSRCYSGGPGSWSFVGPSCPGYRLPTEAEWEYAARAGATTEFDRGPITQTECSPVDPVLDEAGWFCGNSAVSYSGCIDLVNLGGPPCSGTRPVGLKSPNVWGLYDMHGNVTEWVHDVFACDTYDQGAVTDPVGPSMLGPRGFRGGSSNARARFLRAAQRNFVPPSSAFQYLGLRPVRGQ